MLLKVSIIIISSHWDEIFAVNFLAAICTNVLHKNPVPTVTNGGGGGKFTPAMPPKLRTMVTQ